MSLKATEEESAAQEIHIPADIEWKMLNKSKFFFLGAALFSGLSAALHPVVVLKTRQQVAHSQVSCIGTSIWILKHEGFRGFYRGFGSSLTGTIPARPLYMATFEVTKSNVNAAATRLGFRQTTATAIASAAAGMSAAITAQLVWTPVDVISQRLMAQGGCGGAVTNVSNPCRYLNGIDAFKKIVNTDGIRGLYRGFGISILAHAPSNAVGWASYSVAERLVWGGMGSFLCKNDESRLENQMLELNTNSSNDNRLKPDAKAVMAVKGVSAAMAGGLSALITMPIDTIKTRLQVLDGDENGRKGPSVSQTVRNLVREGGWMACYRGLGPRWVSMSMSGATMITAYEFLKRISAKNHEV